MDELLLSNLAKNQAFDAALKRGTSIDRMAANMVGKIILEPDEKRRGKAIGQLKGQLVNHFAKQVIPDSQKIGRANARAVLETLNVTPIGFDDPALRRRILIDLELRPAERLRIVQAMVNDKANTLENRLVAFWLEPGRNPKQKLDQLRDLHLQLDARQKKYNEELAKFFRNEGPRPRKPNLDFMPRFTNDVKQDFRQQARRAGTDAETATFVRAGRLMLTWVTVNAAEACPDCRAMNGVTLSIEEWDKRGKPGSGNTVCGAACFCMLVPAETVTANPKLAQEGLKTGPTVLLPEDVAAAAAESKEAKKDPPPFPESADDLQHLREVKPLGGSTGAKLVEDQHGQRFVMKRGSSAAHLREEYAAEQAYRAAGVKVPDSKLYEPAKGGPVKLSKFIDGRTLGSLKGEDRAAADKQLREGFAADALLSNWDVVGSSADNVLVDAKGAVYRVDVGGALRYRAQGTPKGDAFTRYPTELWSLQDAKQNPQTAAAFGPVTHAEKVEQAKALIGKRAAIMAEIPAGVETTMAGRFDELARFVKTSETLTGDKWKEEYVGRFSRHAMQIRAQGIVDVLPAKLDNRGSGVTVYDGKGKEWDDLRGDNSAVKRVAAYVDANGGKYKSLEYWFSGQAGSSWSVNSQASKWFLAQQRDVSIDTYVWKDGAEKAKKYFDLVKGKAGGEVYEESITAYHAYTYEFLQAVDFPLNDRAAGTVELMRTEPKTVIQGLYGLKRGATGATMKRGVAESFSLYKKVTVHGSEMTTQAVPHQRVLGIYFHERTPGSGNPLFLSDGENEVLAMPEGVSFDYKAGKDS